MPTKLKKRKVECHLLYTQLSVEPMAFCILKRDATKRFFIHVLAPIVRFFWLRAKLCCTTTACTTTATATTDIRILTKNQLSLLLLYSAARW